jgi:hypothetical protein
MQCAQKPRRRVETPIQFNASLHMLTFRCVSAPLSFVTDFALGWYAIRCYFKDLKGKFDFARVQVLLACVFVQLATCALLPLSYSYFVLGHSLPCVYAHVIADNALVAFDIALSLSLLIDLVAAGVAINRACGTHTTALQEQEMQRSFALTNPDARVEAGGEQAVVDSIAQLKALREYEINTAQSNACAQRSRMTVADLIRLLCVFACFSQAPYFGP